jgi:hypothetical protein
MEAEKEVDLLRLIHVLERHRVRYLIIGRRAVILYGAPVLTGDHDLWFHPSDKKKTLALLADLGFELSHPPETRRPIVTGFSGMKKYDLFFHRRVTSFENEAIDFETCYERSTLLEDRAAGVRFRIPSIDDLIRLKKVREPNAKDQQDIEYLLKARGRRAGR